MIAATPPRSAARVMRTCVSAARRTSSYSCSASRAVTARLTAANGVVYGTSISAKPRVSAVASTVDGIVSCVRPVPNPRAETPASTSRRT